MITFPPEFAAFPKFPGYFWNTQTETLYSIKCGGVLRELKRTYPNQWNHFKSGYTLSLHGKRRIIQIDDLKKLCVTNFTIPMEK